MRSLIPQISSYLTKELREKIEKAVYVSISFDETTDISLKPQVVIFIRGIDADFNIFEEMMTLCQLKETSAKGYTTVILKACLQIWVLCNMLV